MKASFKVLALGLFLMLPLAAAHAQTPSMSPIANLSLNAGTTRTVNIVAVEPEGDPITITASLPPFVTLNAPTFGTGSVVTTLTLSPAAINTGDFTAAVTATPCGLSSVPVLAIPPIADVTVAGGDFASVPVSASGVPGALISLTASLPSFGTLNPPGTGTGSVNTTIALSPPIGSAGTYHASVTAISENTQVTEDFDIIVTGAGPA